MTGAFGGISSDSVLIVSDSSDADPDCGQDIAEGDITAADKVHWRGILLSALGLLICTNGPSSFIALHVDTADDGWRSWMYFYPFATVSLVGLFALLRTLRNVNWHRWPIPLVGVGAFASCALASTVWSVLPGNTLSAALIGLGIVSFGCWFGWQLQFEEQVLAVVTATSVAALASLFLVVFFPQYGKMAPEFYPDIMWQGIFANRNSLSPVCALGLISLVGFVAILPSIQRILVACWLAMVQVVLLLGSAGLTSVAALAVGAFVGVAVCVVWQFKGRFGGRSVAIGAVGLAGSLCVALFANLNRLAVDVGRDVTLSGRRGIWREVRGLIRDRPIGGYGFYAFWDSPTLTAATYSRVGAPYGSAHSSALEVLLGLGIVGLIPFLFVVLYAVVGIAHFVWARPSPHALWWAMTLAFLLTQNTMESFVLWHSYNWVLIVAAAFVPFQARAGFDSDNHRATVGLTHWMHSTLHRHSPLASAER